MNLISMKYFSLLFTLTFLSSLNAQSVYQPDYELQNLIRIKDEIPEGNSNAVKMTSSGLKIVGGQGNVCIFALKNRVALISYANITGGSQNAFNDKVVLCPLDSITLVADKDGLGWINNNDFSSDRIVLPEEIAGKDISHIVAAGKKDALLLIGGKLYQYNNNKSITYSGIPDLIAIEKINDNLIIAISEKQAFQIHVLQASQISYNVLKTVNAGKDSFVNLFAASNKQFVIQTKKGFCQVYADSGQFELLRTLHLIPGGIAVRGVKLLEDNYFIGTLYDGLLGYYKSDNYQEARSILLKTSSGKPLRQILSLELTDDNALLIGTRGGGLLEYSPIRSATFAPFFPLVKSVSEYHDFSIRSIYQFQNLVYFGTDEGQVYRFDISSPKASPVNLDLNFNLKNLQIRSLYATEDALYIGTGVDVARVYKFNRKFLKSPPEFLNLEGRQVSVISKKGNYLYIGTDKQLIKIPAGFLSGKTTKLEILLPNQSIKNLVEDKNGIIFVLSAEGKIFLLPESEKKPNQLKISHISDKSIVLNKDLLHMTAAPKKDEYYLFTRGDFIWKAKLDGTSNTIKLKLLEQYNHEKGLLAADKTRADVVYGGFVDKAGTLWCSTDKGIYCKKADSDFFYRLTPEVLGLPDNPDGNTGAYFKVNDSTLIFGFRQGGVVIHSKKFNASRVFTPKMFVLEQLDDGKFRMIHNKDSISKNQNFSVINLIPYSIDNNYPGAEPVAIKAYNSSNKAIKNTFSLNGLGCSIFPKDFSFFIGILGSGENEYTFEATNSIQVAVSFHETQKFYLLTIVLYCSIIVIFLVVIYSLYKYFKNLKDKKIKTAEEKAKNAERENDIKRDTISLAEKALGEHFLKNTLSEIRRTTALDAELDHNFLLKAIFQHSGIELETAQDFLEKTAIELKKNPGNRVLIPHRLKLLCEKAINKESVAYTLLSRYAEFVNMLIENKKESGEIADSVIGYYSMLVSDKTESSIKKDKELLENLFNLYTINPGHKLKGETIEIKIDSLNPKFEDVKIPRLLTQPLIENARNKGDRPLGLSVIYQHIQSSGNDFMKVSVTNNGKWVENQQNSFKEDMSNRHALDIIQDIVAKLKGEWLGHREESTPANGQSTVTVSFIIPILIN